MLPTFELKVEIVWCEFPVMGQVSARDLTCSYCARSFFGLVFRPSVLGALYYALRVNLQESRILCFK